MLRKVILENFQAHEHSEIDFTEGVNVICGASDQGKSSVIRAIRWVLENRPSGFGFRREGAETPTRVTLDFDEGTIVRERSAMENCYKIYKNGQTKPIVLQALRSDVPDEVKEVSRFGEYNIQYQTGKAFLIDDSDGDVAKKINSLSGVSVIDNILKETNSRLRAEKAKEKAVKELLSDLKTKKEEFKNLARAERKFKTLKTIHAEHEEYKGYHKDLETLIANFKALEALPVVDVELAEEKMKILRNAVDEFQEYVEISESIRESITNVKKFSKALEAYKHLAMADSLLKNAKKAAPALVDAQTRAARLKTCLENFEKYDQGFKQSVRNAKKAVDDLAIFKKENKLCPVCNKKW